MRENSNTISDKVKKEIEEITKRFAEKIRAQRSKLNISMAELYSRSGVSSSTINDVEKERYLPHLEVMLKVALALDLSKQEVMRTIDPNTDITFNDGNEFPSKQERKKRIIKLIKCLLRDINFSENTIAEILDFIEFKSKYTRGILDSYK